MQIVRLALPYFHQYDVFQGIPIEIEFYWARDTSIPFSGGNCLPDLIAVPAIWDDFEIIHTYTVQFGPGSSELTREAAETLDQLVEATKGQAGILYQVMGYASSDGPAEYNRKLSRDRADAVIQYLAEEYQLPLRRFIRPHGFGELMAVADNSTAEGRKMNRRAEVKVLLNRGLSKIAN